MTNSRRTLHRYTDSLCIHIYLCIYICVVWCVTATVRHIRPDTETETEPAQRAIKGN